MMKDDKRFLTNVGPGMLVMIVLKERPRHGYDIAKEIELASGGDLVFRQGTLYPILRKLEEKGLISGVWESPGNERERRVYSLTDKGLVEVDKQLEAWKQYVHAVGQVIKETAG